MRVSLLRNLVVLGMLLLPGTLPKVHAQANGTPGGEPTAVGPISRVIPPSAFKFPIGQNFVYAVEWRLWDAGTATLSMTADTSGAMRTAATADSSGVVSVLYPVHDRFQAVFDPRTFCSQSLVKHVEEGFRSRETLISFNYGRRRSVLDETNRKNNERKHQDV
ncbi:MAG: DUF3108 domain-containing protein, partial [Candidatus Korobacteraceae bacterium]